MHCASPIHHSKDSGSAHWGASLAAVWLPNIEIGLCLALALPLAHLASGMLLDPAPGLALYQASTGALLAAMVLIPLLPLASFYKWVLPACLRLPHGDCQSPFLSHLPWPRPLWARQPGVELLDAPRDGFLPWLPPATTPARVYADIQGAPPTVGSWGVLFRDLCPRWACLMLLEAASAVAMGLVRHLPLPCGWVPVALLLAKSPSVVVLAVVRPYLCPLVNWLRVASGAAVCGLFAVSSFIGLYEVRHPALDAAVVVLSYGTLGLNLSSVMFAFLGRAVATRRLA